MLSGIKLIDQPIKETGLLDEKFNALDRIGLRIQNGFREVVKPLGDLQFSVRTFQRCIVIFSLRFDGAGQRDQGGLL